MVKDITLRIRAAVEKADELGLGDDRTIHLYRHQYDRLVRENDAWWRWLQERSLGEEVTTYNGCKLHVHPDPKPPVVIDLRKPNHHFTVYEDHQYEQ